MTPPDIATTLRKVSALRSLCLRLPHAPTPAETRLLELFEALVAAPERAAVVDLDAIAAGWHYWWREGQYAQLLEMRSRLSSGLTDDDRDLSALAQAAMRHRWTELQMRIETCTACANLRPSEVSRRYVVGRPQYPRQPSKSCSWVWRRHGWVARVQERISTPAGMTVCELACSTLWTDRRFAHASSKRTDRIGRKRTVGSIRLDSSLFTHARSGLRRVTHHRPLYWGHALVSTSWPRSNSCSRKWSACSGIRRATYPPWRECCSDKRSETCPSVPR